MQFSDTTNKLGIVEDIDFYIDTDSTQYTLANKTRNINERFRLIWTIIFESYGGWLFMDDNSSDATTGVPYADQTLTSGTGLYLLPTGTLTVRGVSILDSNGNRTKLRPITHDEYMQRGEAYFNSSGTPQYYLLQGDVIRLLNTPNYTKTSDGLRVHFDAGVSAFAASDTTKTPGFASPFHRMLSLGAAIDYAVANNMTKKISTLQPQWNDYEMRLRSFYAKRLVERTPTRIPPMEDLVQEFS